MGIKLPFSVYIHNHFGVSVLKSRAAKLSEAECWRLLNIRVDASAEPRGGEI